MALNMMGLGFVFEAVDHASHVITQIEHKFTQLEEHTGLKVTGMQDKFKVLGVGLAALYTGMKGLQGAFELAEHAAEAEQGLLSLQAVTGATAEEMEKLEKAAIKATEGTNFGSGKGVDTLKKLMQQSFDTKDAIELLRPVLDFSALTEGSVSPEAAAEGISKVMKAYEIDVGDAATVVDQMAQAVTKWGLSASSLPMALARAEKGARQINASMTEVMMVTGLVKDGFRNQIVAANEVGQAMAKLADPKTVAAFGKFKDKMNMKDANGEFRSFMDIATDLDPILKQMGPEKEKDWLNKTFGPSSVMEKTINKLRLGIKDTNGQLVQGAAAAHALQNGFIDSKDKAKDMIDVLNKGFGSAIKQVEKMKADIMEELGMGFLKVLTPAIKAAAKEMGLWVDKLRALPMPVKEGIALFAILAFTTIAVVGGLMAMSVAFFFLKIATAFAWKTMLGFASAAWAAIVPMLPWIVLGLAVVAVIYMLIFHSDWLLKKWHELVEWWNTTGIALALLGLAVLFMTGILGTWVTAVWGAVTAWWALNAAMFMNPVGLIVLGVIALIALIWALGHALEGMGLKWSDVLEKFILKPLRDVYNAMAKIFDWDRWPTPEEKAKEVADAAAKKAASGIPEEEKTEEAPAAPGFFEQMFSGGVPGMPGAGTTGMPGAIPGMPEGMPGMPAMPEGMAKMMEAAQKQGGVEGGTSSPEQMSAMLAAAQQQGAGVASIDYDELAAAMARVKIDVNIDGDTIGAAIVRSQRVSMARAGVSVPSE